MIICGQIKVFFQGESLPSLLYINIFKLLNTPRTSVNHLQLKVKLGLNEYMFNLGWIIHLQVTNTFGLFYFALNDIITKEEGIDSNLLERQCIRFLVIYFDIIFYKLGNSDSKFVIMKFWDIFIYWKLCHISKQTL